MRSRVLMICSVILILIAGLGISAAATNESSEWLYNDTIAGYSIQYPAGANIFFTESSDHIREFWVATPQNSTILKVSARKTNISLMDNIEERVNITSSLAGYSFVRNESIDIDRIPAYLFEYTWTADKVEIKSFQILTVRDGWLYVLRHDDTAENYDKDAGLLSHLTDSFHFISITGPDKVHVTSDSGLPDPGIATDDFDQPMDWSEGTGTLGYIIPSGVDYFGRYWYYNLASGEWLWDYGGYMLELQSGKTVIGKDEPMEPGKVEEGPGGLVLKDIGGGCDGSYEPTDTEMTPTETPTPYSTDSSSSCTT